jgi:hypothetical protein
MFRAPLKVRGGPREYSRTVQACAADERTKKLCKLAENSEIGLELLELYPIKHLDRQYDVGGSYTCGGLRF